jgi:hypothetical protein
LGDEQLLGTRCFGIVDDPAVDASSEVLEEARVELVVDGRFRRVDESGRVHRQPDSGELGGVGRLRGQVARPGLDLQSVLEDSGHGEDVEGAVV